MWMKKKVIKVSSRVVPTKTKYVNMISIRKAVTVC